MNESMKRGVIEDLREPLRDGMIVGMLTTCFLIGLPLNLKAFKILVKEFKSNRKEKQGLAILKLNLNISNMLVLAFYAPSRVIYQLTLEWKAGDIMCPLVKFFQILSFQISSATLAAIALDRVITVIKHRSNTTVRALTLSLIAWLYAIVFSAPMLFTWETMETFDSTINRVWKTCVDSFTVARITGFKGELTGSEAVWAGEMEKLAYIHQAINISQLITTFWFPFVITFFCYLFILVEVYHHQRRYTNSTENSKLNARSECSYNYSKTQAHLKAISRQGNASLLNEESLGGSRISNLDDVENSKLQPKSKGQDITKIRERSQSLRSTVLLINVFMVCWCPYNIVALWTFFDYSSFWSHPSLAQFNRVLSLLITVNNVVNPFLYAVKWPSMADIKQWLTDTKNYCNTCFLCSLNLDWLADQGDTVNMDICAEQVGQEDTNMMMFEAAVNTKIIQKAIESKKRSTGQNAYSE